jgi:hypothetical protein
MFNFFKRIQISGQMFNGHFIDVKAFYVAQFNKVPCVTFIGDMDVSKTFAFIGETYYRDIKATYQHAYFNHDDQKVYFNNTIIVLSFERMIEIADNYCQLLHNANQYSWARTLVTELAQFRIEKDVATAYRHTHVVGFAKETAMN